MILREIIGNPLYNIVSFFITLISVFFSILPLLTFISISNLEILQKIAYFTYLYFTTETIIRIFSKHHFFRSYFLLDFFSLIPFILAILFKLDSESPAMKITQSVFFLRLVPTFQYLLRLKSFHLRENIPSFINQFSSIVSLTVFGLLLIWISAFSFFYIHYNEAEKNNRIYQIENLTKIYTIKEIKGKYPEWILKIENHSKDNNYEIFFIDKNFLQKYLISGKHFIYLQGVNPSEGIIVSFVDLYRNQNFLIFTFLVLSFLIVAFVNFLIQFYFKKKWLYPIERSFITTQLRLKGEFIPKTEIEVFHNHEENNEINVLIKKYDELYLKLLEIESPK